MTYYASVRVERAAVRRDVGAACREPSTGAGQLPLARLCFRYERSEK